MNELSAVLRTLRQEIEEALSAGLCVPDIAQLEAEVVTLTLAMVLDSQNGTSSTARWRPLTTSLTATSAHSLTIQFRVTKAGVVAQGTKPEEKRGVGSQVPTLQGEVLASRCVPVFGEPGFDNSARAEVFSELVAEYPGAEMIAALSAVSGQRQAGLPAPPERLVLRLRQVLGFAPAGREAAAGVLQRLFQEFSREEVVGVISERWRFGTHWSLPPDDAPTQSNG